VKPGPVFIIVSIYASAAVFGMKRRSKIQDRAPAATSFWVKMLANRFKVPFII
jgi:hypothetical protein